MISEREGKPAAAGRSKSKWRFPRSIRGRLLSLLLVVLVPALLLQGAIYYGRFEERYDREVQANLGQARSLAAAFDNYVKDILTHLAILEAALAAPQPAEQLSHAFATTAREVPSIYHLAYLDPYGRLIVSSDPGLAALEASYGPYVQQIARGEEWLVGDLFQAPPTGKAAFVVARRVREGSGALRGVMVSTADADYLGEVLTAQRSTKVSFSIVDRKGWSVLRQPPAGRSREERGSLSTQPQLAEALAGKEFTGIVVSPADGQERIVARVPIPSVGWAVSAGRLKAEVMAPIYEDLLRDFGILLLVSAVAFVTALTLGFTVSRPIRRLQEQALAIGRGEFGPPVEVAGLVELEHLAQAVNWMAGEMRTHGEEREQHIAGLQQAEEVVRRAHAELEVRIGERTAELAAANEALQADMAAREQAEEARARLIAIVEATSDFVAMCDTNYRILYVNRAGRAMLGLGEDESVANRTVSDNHPAWSAALIFKEAFPTAARVGLWKGETALSSKDGREIAVSQVILCHRARDGAIRYFSTIARDITEHKQHEQQLAYLATHDHLTGLPNRRLLEDAMGRTVARARRGTVSVLLFFDVDNFKTVNDRLDHAAGDQVLVRLTQLLREQLRSEDLLARHGGDEFAVLLEGIDIERALEIAERLRQSVERFDFALGGQRFDLSISIGLVPIDGKFTLPEILSQADAALHQAKDQGRNRVVLRLPVGAGAPLPGEKKVINSEP